MSARYLIRLDDACHSMDHRRWWLVERLLDDYGIKPIVAVVPDNKDPKLEVDARNEAFWDTVRAWAAKGWAVAMHGHTHVMHPTTSPLLLPYYQRSEFGGLTFDEQATKIRASWRIFSEQGVEPIVWVAPAHSFDSFTLKALAAETPIRIVSDGIAWDTYHDAGFHWIPQQLWRFSRRWSGLWTVCLHPNTMSDAAIASLAEAIRDCRNKIVCIEQVKLSRRKKSPLGMLYHWYFWRHWQSLHSKAL